jgi:hypothetical protein
MPGVQLIIISLPLKERLNLPRRGPGFLWLAAVLTLCIDCGSLDIFQTVHPAWMSASMD